jgi:hypothetical protein
MARERSQFQTAGILKEGTSYGTVGLLVGNCSRDCNDCLCGRRIWRRLSLGSVNKDGKEVCSNPYI